MYVIVIKHQHTKSYLDLSSNVEQRRKSTKQEQ